MNYKVSVNGERENILTTNIFPMPYNEVQKMEYALFTMDQSVDIVIESQIEVNSVVIRPLSAKIEYKYKDNKIYIHLDEPKKFSVEINNSYKNNILIFAGMSNYSDFDVHGENVLYFNKGIHDVDILQVNEDNTVVYLEEGAFLNGKIEAKNCKNITICGYGIISMEKYPRNIIDVYGKAIDVFQCENVTIKDITITDSNGWSLKVSGCEDVAIDNVKIIGCRGNSDGIDICGSRNVLVENIFTRVWDDSFVVKAFDTGNLENVTFKDSVLWNDFARPIEVGVELRAEKVRNIRFENIDIIHSPTGYPLMGIHHGDRAEVSDITFENIRIEDTPGAQLFDIRITDSVWNTDSTKGNIKNIHFKDINYIGKPGMDHLLSKSRIQGFSEECNIQNVTFENIRILGKAAANSSDCGLLGMDYVDNVEFKYDENENKINLIKTNISFVQDFILQKDGTYKGIVKIKAENVSDHQQNVKIWLQVSPVNTAQFDNKIFNLELEPNASAAKDYDVILPPGKYVFCVQSDSECVDGDWRLVNLDWVIHETENILAANEFEFINYYNIRAKGIKAAIYNNELILQSDILKDKNNSLVLYSAMPVIEQVGEVKFTVEETDFGEAVAVIKGKKGLELAPQLRCPAEITHVFKNEPKVKEIKVNVIAADNGDVVKIPFSALGLLDGTKHFWLEIEARTKQVEKFRYPYTLFHSVNPRELAHMFADVVVL